MISKIKNLFGISDNTEYDNPELEKVNKELSEENDIILEKVQALMDTVSEQQQYGIRNTVDYSNSTDYTTINVPSVTYGTITRSTGKPIYYQNRTPDFFGYGISIGTSDSQIIYCDYCGEDKKKNCRCDLEEIKKIEKNDEKEIQKELANSKLCPVSEKKLPKIL